VEALLGYSERLMRAGLRRIPEGVYRFEDRLDDDGVSDEPVRIAVEITVKGDEVIADFTGSSAQRPAPINCSLSMTTAVVHYCLVAAVGADVPVNEGCFRPVTVIAPEGTVINALPPAPVVGRMATLHRTCDAVNGALAQALPDRIPAAYYGMSTTTMMSGVGENGGMKWVLFEIQVGGWGGQSWRDGFEACSAMIHNPANTPVEMIERMYPVRIERYALRRDSGGPGMHRGGMGIDRDTRLLEGRAVITVLGDRMKNAPYGLNGGLPGGATEIVVDPGGPNERRLPSKVTGVPIGAGEVFGTRTGGGGGWGDPRKRDRAAVRRDLALGKIGPKAAREIYGLDDA
jgi:N-methylhydantoinase B